MEMFNGKIYNDEVFETYMRKVESTKENSLIKNALFTRVNKYKSKMVGQTGGYFIVEPIKGRIGGQYVNYDGKTDITSSSRETYYQTKICFGRAKAWGEDDFTSEITGEDFMAEASEITEYWDEMLQETTLSILKGIFSMTGSNGFAQKHTYETDGKLGADTLNRASQKTLGDKKANLDVIYTHSAVSTNLEGLNLVDFIKYTDARGITRDLKIGTYNGKTIVVDDEMPVENGYDEATETTEGALKVVASGATTGEINLGDVKKGDFYPADVAANDYVKPATKYTSFLFKNGYFEIENLGVVKSSELVRNATERGGHTDLVSRVRYIIVPNYISYTKTDNVSPELADFANGANWEVANNNKTGNDKKYVDDKLLPIIRIISRG